MIGLDAKMFATMRSVVTQYYPDPVSFYSVARSYTADGTDVYTRTFTASGTGQLSDVTGSERAVITALVSAGTEKLETLKLMLPYGTSINTDYEVQTADGKYWQIANADSSQTFTAALKVLLYRKLVDSQQVQA
jgi:hypothetical protein